MLIPSVLRRSVPPVASASPPRPFNEVSLREAIARTWGEHGAHMDVFDHLVRRAVAAATQRPPAPDRERVEELGREVLRLEAELDHTRASLTAARTIAAATVGAIPECPQRGHWVPIRSVVLIADQLQKALDEVAELRGATGAR